MCPTPSLPLSSTHTHARKHSNIRMTQVLHQLLSHPFLLRFNTRSVDALPVPAHKSINKSVQEQKEHIHHHISQETLLRPSLWGKQVKLI